MGLEGEGFVSGSAAGMGEYFDVFHVAGLSCRWLCVGICRKICCSISVANDLRYLVYPMMIAVQVFHLFDELNAEVNIFVAKQGNGCIDSRVLYE